MDEGEERQPDAPKSGLNFLKSVTNEIPVVLRLTRATPCTLYGTLQSDK
jgi:hypothetical protein